MAVELPFAIQLNDFIAEKYPGTEKSYASFMSKVRVEDTDPFEYDIYMNHVLDHKGYRFFQASFNPDEKAGLFSCISDILAGVKSLPENIYIKVKMTIAKIKFANGPPNTINDLW